MIRIEDVRKDYRMGESMLAVLKSLSLKIDQGEFVAIMGPSGSGKSTLMNILGCLDTMDTGRYWFGDQRVDGMKDDELAVLRNRSIGFVFQLFNLLPRINARRNVELPMVYAGVPREERAARATRALQRVGLADRAEHSPAQLSGGQQQRVAIARALVNDPQVLIADEPTGSLDSAASREVMGILGELHEHGKTIIMVTHEEDIARHAQRILRLRDGAIERDEVVA
jgi:putative ABC transport system ATP-binding protein